MTVPALLEARGCTLSVAGRRVLGPFDATTAGDLVALVGDVAPLMSLLMNVAPGAIELARGPDPAFAASSEVLVASGSLRVAGRDVTSAESRARVGVAPLDPPLPPDLTVTEYLVASARLAGLGRAAKVEAARALETLGGGGAARRRLVTLGVGERRLLLLSQAIIGSPEVIVVEAPLAHLDDATAEFVLTAFLHAAEGRRVIIGVDRAGAGTRDAPILERASSMLQFSKGELVAAGTPADVAAIGTRWQLTVRSNAEALAAELERSGVKLEGGPVRFSVSLGEGLGTDVIMKAASAARAAVVDLSSLG